MLSDEELFSFVRNPRLVVPELAPSDRHDPMSDMYQHLLVLWTTARFLPALTVVELGTNDGTSTLPLLKAAAENSGVMHSVDIAPCPAAVAAVARYQLSPWWRFHMMSTAAFAASPACPTSIDLLFIDADHGYDSVKHDFEAFAPRVRRGGLILMHDYLLEQPAGVKQFIEELKLKAWTPATYEIAVLPYCYGLVIIRKL